MDNLIQIIEDFLNYGEKKLGLNALDKIHVRNALYNEFHIYPNGDYPSAKKDVHDVNYFVDYFTSYYHKQNLDDTNINIKISHLFDLISPRPSEVNATFNLLYKKNPQLATSYLYQFGINNYYIHKRDIDRNLEWQAKFEDGPEIEISINLSKPEKDNKDIAKLLKAAPSVNYPKCVLCLENLGFVGNEKKAPRHNIRIIPLKLNGENWFLQYSPYGYFFEHMILVDQKHEYMEISPRIFKLLFAFNKMFPYYTIGSNSDLPIVGGSILNHEHFQGGKHVFPLQKAHDLFVIKSKKYHKSKISYLDFYNSAFKIQGKDANEIIEIASLILKKWRVYSDKNASIFAQTDKVHHNTITPILRRNNKGEYEFILILRNNGTNAKYPDGIFHVHPQYFAIKKEGIGLIEAMGRFILPARLVRQIKEVKDVVKNQLSEKTYLKKYPDLLPFKAMIDTLKANKKMSPEEYVNDVGRHILLNTAVFKRDANGMKCLKKFINALDL